MRLRRIPRSEPYARCFECHNRAQMEVSYGPHHPIVRLCLRDARYQSGFMQRLIRDHDQGKPIPPIAKFRDDDDARGNR